MSDLNTEIMKRLDNYKALNIVSLDVSSQPTTFQRLIISTGTSSRHADGIARKLVDDLKKDIGIGPKHIEQDSDCSWILIDYGTIVVHILQEATRKFYALERLWGPLDEPRSEIEL